MLDKNEVGKEKIKPKGLPGLKLFKLWNKTKANNPGTLVKSGKATTNLNSQC